MDPLGLKTLQNTTDRALQPMLLGNQWLEQLLIIVN
jgi:hypothetical protein